jgi:hypothetical protein
VKLGLPSYLHWRVSSRWRTASGFGCLASLPDRAPVFTTAELKANFIGTPREGAAACDRPAIAADKCGTPT